MNIVAIFSRHINEPTESKILEKRTCPFQEKHRSRQFAILTGVFFIPN